MAAVVHPQVDATWFSAVVAETGWRANAELIEGEVVHVPPDGDPAGDATATLITALRTWTRAAPGRGRATLNTFVVLDERNLQGPDVAWWREERRPPRTEGAIRSVPDLVAEVLSPSTRANDLGPKREVYERVGVVELWLIDPDARLVTVLRRGAAGRFDSSEILGADAVLESPLLPGFALSIAELFADG